MKVEIFETEQYSDLCFAVSLCPTLPMPDYRRTIDGLQQYAIAAAKFDDVTGWGYLWLNEVAKEEIGFAMLRHGCDMLRWYYCIVSIDDELEK